MVHIENAGWNISRVEVKIRLIPSDKNEKFEILNTKKTFEISQSVDKNRTLNVTSS